MSLREVVICSPVRIGIGTYNGSLKATLATELGAIVVCATLDRSKFDKTNLGAVKRSPEATR